MSRCSATVNFFQDEHPLYPAVVNDKDLYAHFKKVATEMLGPDKVLEPAPVTVSEDFAFYQEKLKGFFFFLGIMNETVGSVSVHSPLFQLAEDSLPYGAALQATLATSYLSDLALQGPQSKSYRDEL